MALAKVGGTPKGGNNRQTLTDLDGKGRHLLRGWCEAIGLTMTVDRIGNMVFRREGKDPSRKPIAIGSHIDTQPTGGKFDGPLGVLTGLEVLRAIHEAGVETDAPIVLINWTNEEGARFAPPMMGSGTALGFLDEAATMAATDAEGAVFGEELRRIGWQGKADPASTVDLEAYFEVHIEQGPTLERDGISIGLVTHALAQSWFDVTVTGEDAHAGSAMATRKDALVGASELIMAVERIAIGHPGEGGELGRGTVGTLTVMPASRNVVPGEVRFNVDHRHGDPKALAKMNDALFAEAAAIALKRGLKIEVTPFWESPLVPFDATLLEHLAKAAEARGHSARRMPTGIGHDAVYMARKVPSALIFVPCAGGISHNEAENITIDWARAGLEVLADAVLAAAGPRN
ncbi:Zn-dependent hydrolase [Acetobacteraceae bacterium H6797]|nr:Zn-dependent hydrolase [Acetobacteraceae bacterium H6797]